LDSTGIFYKISDKYSNYLAKMDLSGRRILPLATSTSPMPQALPKLKVMMKMQAKDYSILTKKNVKEVNNL